MIGASDGVLTIALLSGFGAGLVAILATVAIERLGGHLGGVIGTLPTTIIPASWGLWRQNLEAVDGGIINRSVAHEHFEAAMYAVPAGMCLNAIFLWLWRVIPQRLSIFDTLYQEGVQQQRSRLWSAVLLMSVVTLSLWLLGALVLVSLSRTYFTNSATRLLAGIGATLAIILIGVWATSSRYQAPRGQRSVSKRTLSMRGLCAAAAVGVSVLISKSGATTIAGVAAVFPAIFWTTMASLWLSQGRAVPAGAVGPMMIGSSSVALFALVAPALYAHLGVALGATCAWLIAALCASVPSYLWVRHIQGRA